MEYIQYPHKLEGHYSKTLLNKEPKIFTYY